MPFRRRLNISLEEFEAIVDGVDQSQPPDLILSAYHESLIINDESVLNVLADPKSRKHATEGQRILFSLSMFDAEVRNGGITQFFWNCVDLVGDVGDALRALVLPELCCHFERAVEAFLSKQEEWYHIQEQAEVDEPYADSYQKYSNFFRLSWFDARYDELSNVMATSLMDYVRTHPDDFIEP